MNWQKIVLFISLFVLSGCATGYQPIGFTGGYSDMQLGENSFKVSFTGNGHTLQQRAMDFTLLRSSDLTLKNGYRYFIVNSSETHNRTSFYVNQYGGGSISKPRATMIISCFKEKPVETNRMIFDAKFLSASIRKKYGLSEGAAEDSIQTTSTTPAHDIQNPSRSVNNSDETIQYLLHRSGPKHLREFMTGYRTLYTTDGKDFFTDLLSSPWYASFKKTHQRNPIIVILDQGKDSTESVHSRQVWLPVHGGLLFYFVRQPWADKDYVQETLLKSGKVGVVIYKHRELSSGERMFQMKHAATQYVKEPGHLDGADAVLILTEKKSRTQPLAFKPEDMDMPVEVAKVTPISLDIKLIDIATDELLWTHLYPLTVEINDTYCKPPEPEFTGTPSFVNSCFSPN